MEPLKIRLDNWQVGQYDKNAPDHLWPSSVEDSIPAQVPGCVQYDLMREGRLANPYASTKAALEAAWVAQSDWLYETVFDIQADIQAYTTVILKLWGVDTFSEIWLNGVCLGDTDSAYRSYEIRIDRKILLPRNNLLKIRVKAHARMIEDKLEDAKRLKRGEETEGLLGKSLIRRYQRSFFTTSSLLNIGTGVLGIGINRPVELSFYQRTYITNVVYTTKTIREEHGGTQAEGYVEISLNESSNSTVSVRMLDEDGECVWENGYEGTETEKKIQVSVQNPKLWWPKGYGIPYLYTLEVSVFRNGQLEDRHIRKIGIRQVQIIQRTPEGRTTFYIAVNGQKIYIHGENYIPMDYLKVYGTKEQYANLFLLLDMQHVNLVRIWGGGAVEDESFFDECDRRGILIWHDLFLHSNVYPDYDPEFVRGFLTEVEGILKTIRSHPCICLICGGNEQWEGWYEYGWQQELDRFYGDSLPFTHTPKLVKDMCPEIPYIYNSPYGGKYAQSPIEGDCHCWGNYYNASKDPLFVSETCWTSESYSRPETLEKYMDLDMSQFEGLGWGEKWTKCTSLPLFTRRPFSSWFDVRSLKAYLYALELEQALADYHALNQFRFMDPSNSGIIYWSFNKGGPLFQFGCVDYDGRPMMSYYVVQRLYKGVSLFPCRDVKDLRVMLSNHLAYEVDVSVEGFYMNAQGEILKEYKVTCDCGAGQVIQALTIKDGYVQVYERSKEVLFVRAKMDGKVVSEDLLLFCPYGELEIVPRPIHGAVKKIGKGQWELTLEAEGIVQMAEIESNIKIVCDDNYFPMMPGEIKCVRITQLEPGSEEGEIQIFVGQTGQEEAVCLTVEQ